MEKDRVKKYCIICGYKLSESGDCQHCKYINSIPNDVSGAFSYVMRNASSDIEDLLIEEVLDKAKKLFLSKLFTVLIVVGLGTNAAIVTYNTIKENVIENKIDELIEIYNQGENKDIYNYSLNINATNENKTLATIEIPNYSIKDNITIDTYTGYDIHDFVTADEGVEISSSLNEETSILSIHLEKDLWKVDIDKEVKLINSNPYPITYSIVSNHNSSTMSPEDWKEYWGSLKLIVTSENEVILNYGTLGWEDDVFTKDENGNYSFVSVYEDSEFKAVYTYTLTFDGDKAHVNVNTHGYLPSGENYPGIGMYYNFVKDDNNIEKPT